jgi:undecaprenyl-diphosphatase
MKSAVGKNAYTGTIVSGMEARVPDAALTRAAVDVVSDEPAPVRQEVRSMRGLGALDAALLLKVNRLPHTTTSDKYFSLVSDLGRGVGWAALCGWLAWRGGRHGRRAGLRSTAAMLVANAIAQGPMKQFFGRKRPFHDVGDHIVVGSRTIDTSFPSGHSASSFAAATSLAFAFPQYSPVLLAAASGVGVSRVYLGHHYPSDVAAGVLVGVTVGVAASRWCERDRSVGCEG